MRDAVTTARRFVRKYQSNIGSHPFLAGLRRTIELQSEPKGGGSDEDGIVRWIFLGPVLTEACRSRGNGEDDDLAYARSAVALLHSVLVRVEERDAESGAPAKEPPGELTLTFEVDKYISDANLRRVLSELPDQKSLDSRATGKIETVYDSERRRKNVNGELDEARPWFANLELCNLL